MIKARIVRIVVELLFRFRTHCGSNGFIVCHVGVRCIGAGFGLFVVRRVIIVNDLVI
jgi:hypothetical protein